MPRCGILERPTWVLCSGLDYGQPLHDQSAHTRLTHKKTLGRQYIGERTIVEISHVIVIIKYSVIPVGSPERYELLTRFPTLTSLSTKTACSLCVRQVTANIAPTNTRLPKTIFSIKRAKQRLWLRSHKRTTPENQFHAEASHQKTLALLPATHESRNPIDPPELAIETMWHDTFNWPWSVIIMLSRRLTSNGAVQYCYRGPY